eukprot:1156607-Pelagomonas_calceolata.AAC.6
MPQSSKKVRQPTSSYMQLGLSIIKLPLSLALRWRCCCISIAAARARVRGGPGKVRGAQGYVLCCVLKLIKGICLWRKANFNRMRTLNNFIGSAP